MTQADYTKSERVRGGLLKIEPTIGPDLRQCPECRYSLIGLRAPHCCPECGLAYDQATQVWRPTNHIAIFGTVFGIGIGGLGMLVNPVFYSARVPLARLIPILYIIMMLGVIYYRVRAYRASVFAHVGPDGIHFRLQRLGSEQISWDRVIKVRPRRYDRACDVYCVDRVTAVPIVGVFKTAENVLSFVRLTEHYRSKLRTDDAKSEAPEH